MIQSVITSLEKNGRQLKRVFVQLADTQNNESGVSRRRKRPRERQNRGKKREKDCAKLQLWSP